MTQLSNVTVTKAANIYFNGNVTSRTLTLADGSTQSLGIMMPGEYEFGTVEKELMEIIAGQVSVLLSGESDWLDVNAGESFNVPANSKFNIKVTELTDYCCSYIK